QLFGGKPATDGEPDRDRGIEVAPRDVADRVGHGQNGQPERERDAEKPDPDTWEGRRQDGTSATPEHEPERSQKLRERTLGKRHESSFRGPARCRARDILHQLLATQRMGESAPGGAKAAEGPMVK